MAEQDKSKELFSQSEANELLKTSLQTISNESVSTVEESYVIENYGLHQDNYKLQIAQFAKTTKDDLVPSIQSQCPSKAVIMPRSKISLVGIITMEGYKKIDMSKYDTIFIVSPYNGSDMGNKYIALPKFPTIEYPDQRSFNYKIDTKVINALIQSFPEHIHHSSQSFHDDRSNEGSWYLQLLYLSQCDYKGQIVPILVNENYNKSPPEEMVRFIVHHYFTQSEYFFIFVSDFTRYGKEYGFTNNDIPQNMNSIRNYVRQHDSNLLNALYDNDVNLFMQKSQKIFGHKVIELFMRITKKASIEKSQQYVIYFNGYQMESITSDEKDPKVRSFISYGFDQYKCELSTEHVSFLKPSADLWIASQGDLTKIPYLTLILLRNLIKMVPHLQKMYLTSMEIDKLWQYMKDRLTSSFNSNVIFGIKITHTKGNEIEGEYMMDYVDVQNYLKTQNEGKVMSKQWNLLDIIAICTIKSIFLDKSHSSSLQYTDEYDNLCPELSYGDSYTSEGKRCSINPYSFYIKLYDASNNIVFDSENDESLTMNKLVSLS